MPYRTLNGQQARHNLLILILILQNPYFFPLWTSKRKLQHLKKQFSWLIEKWEILRTSSLPGIFKTISNRISFMPSWHLRNENAWSWFISCKCQKNAQVHACQLKAFYIVWTLQELYHFSLSPLAHGYALQTIQLLNEDFIISSTKIQNPQLKAVTLSSIV